MCCGYDTAAVVEVVFCVIVVPLHVVVTVIDRDIYPVDAEELVEWDLLDKLVNYFDEHVICDKFKVSDEP